MEHKKQYIRPAIEEFYTDKVLLANVSFSVTDKEGESGSGGGGGRMFDDEGIYIGGQARGRLSGQTLSPNRLTNSPWGK